MLNYYFTILKFTLQKIYFRYISLKFWLKVFLITALILIIFCTNFLTEGQRRLSGYDFLIRISYAYLTSFLFYFIVVHTPKEDKKQALYIVINNRTVNIYRILKDYYRYILEVNGIAYDKMKLIDKEEFKKLGSKINSKKPFTIQLNHKNFNFGSHYECYKYMAQIIHKDYDEIMHFYDLLSPSYIYAVNRIHADFQTSSLDGTPIANPTIEVECHILYENLQFVNTAWKELSKFKKKYHQEYRLELRTKNMKKKMGKLNNTA